MIFSLQKLPNNAFDLTITVPWTEVLKTYQLIVDAAVAETEIEGFRKGKAPRELIEKKLDKGKIYGEVVNRILPEVYSQGIKEQNLKPIVSPSVKIVSAEENKDWQFVATACEKPVVELGNYQDAAKTITAKGSIVLPGQPQAEEADKKSKQVSEIISKLLEIVKVELAEIIVEQEVSRMTTALVDDVRAAGLTFEQYLSSKNLTSDSFKQQYRKQAETSLKLEFILEAIAEDLKIEVSPQEVEEVINKEPDGSKKEALKKQSYLLASVMRREKTLTKLASL